MASMLCIVCLKLLLLQEAFKLFLINPLNYQLDFLAIGISQYLRHVNALRNQSI